ncbi:hypothetical protein Peetri_00139 [Pseudomonas phage vB_PpuM-Peetri]
MIKQVKVISLAYFDPLYWSWSLQAPNKMQAIVSVPNLPQFRIDLDRVAADLLIDPTPAYALDTVWNLSIPDIYSNVVMALMADREDQSRVIGTIVDVLLNMHASGNITGVVMVVDELQGAVSQVDPLREVECPPVSVPDMAKIALTRYAEDREWDVLSFIDDAINASGSDVTRHTAFTFPPV